MHRRIHPAEQKFYVYLHSRLSTGEPFYIGKGTGKRVRKHDGRTRLEQKAKLSAALTGRTHSEATKAKMRASQLVRWATIGLRRPDPGDGATP